MLRKLKQKLEKAEADNLLPLYQQIKRDIRQNIHNKVWLPEQKLPSENDLVERLRVSRMTVHRALRELTQEGLLHRVHGVGTFVAKPTRHASLITLQNIADEITTAGFQHRCKVLHLKTIQASNTIASKMEVTPNTPLFHLRAIHYQDDTPIQLEDRLVNPTLAPEFINVNFNQKTATEYLINLIKPDEMEHTIKAILPDLHTARALNRKPVEPCLQLTRRTWKGDTIVTQVKLTYPGNHYALSERYKTEQYSKTPQHDNT